MSRSPFGRHELGQNFLVDAAVVRRIVHLAQRTPGPLVEWGTGDGAITVELATLGREVSGLDIDPVKARRLDERTGPHVCISEGDILRHAPPPGSTVISNIPFNLTTPILRHLLAGRHWQHAIVITQWEVARKRAGIGGTTQLTAQWWPWLSFSLDRRIPAAAFRPRPTVDAGLLLIDRRADPLVPTAQQRTYQRWITRTFTGPGRGLPQILTNSGLPPRAARAFCARHRFVTRGLPRDLNAEQWAEAFRLLPQSGHGR